VAHSFVLDQVLSGESTDVVVENIHNYLTQLSEDIRAGKIAVDKFRINKVCRSWVTVLHVGLTLAFS